MTRRQEAAGRELSDARQLEALGKGHTRALGILYARYQVSVLSYVRRATNDASDVEDVVHATFMTAARAAVNFDGRRSCRSWLVGIAARLLHRRKRSLSRWSRALRELAVDQGGRFVDPHPELVARDAVERLGLAFGRLAEPKRVVLMLAERERLSAQEIAKILLIPVGTVWTRLHYARRDLRRLLSREGQP